MNSENFFGERVFELRKTAGLTQRQVGDAVGLSMQAVNDIEKGRRETVQSKLVAIANFFNVPIDYLTGKGIFSKWEEIMANKDVVLNQLIHDVPALAQYDFCHADERDLMRLLPALIHDITITEISKGIQIDMELYPLWDK